MDYEGRGYRGSRDRVTFKLVDKAFDAFFLFKEASASFRFYTLDNYNTLTGN